MLEAGDAVVLRMLRFVRSRECSFYLGAGDAGICQEQGMSCFFGSRGCCGFEDPGVCQEQGMLWF